MTYAKIRYDRVGDVAVIALDDPATLNAMSDMLGGELRAALARAEIEARAVVLGTTGRAFCSGANLGAGGPDIADPERDAGARLERLINPLILQMRALSIPIVTAIKGAAAGVGCGMAIAGDLIVAGEGAFFYQAFAKVGLTPDGGSTYLLAKAIGRVRAMELMLLGGKLPARQAFDWGLVNRVVADDQVEAVALEIAQTLATGPRSIGMIKASAWAALESTLEVQLGIERAWQREAGRTEDYVEGVLSFREKRLPAFRGR
jgi:2-(1,2-epoxy-1,2-dihydrophenyl)acetyl-CoA isomerase